MGCSGNNGFIQGTALTLFDASSRGTKFDNLRGLALSRGWKLKFEL